MLNLPEHVIFSANEYKNAKKKKTKKKQLTFSYLLADKISCWAELSWAWKQFYNLGSGSSKSVFLESDNHISIYMQYD